MLSPLIHSLGPLTLPPKVAGFDFTAGNPYHYFDAEVLAGLYQEEGGDPVGADGDFVTYANQGGTEALFGGNGGFQYKASVSLGSYTGPALYSGSGGNRSLHGSTEYGGDETFIAVVYGVGWGGGLKGVLGKTANKGQLFFNGDTLELSVYNENGAFVATGLSVGGGPYQLVLKHLTSGSTTKVSVNGGSSYFTTTSAGNNWYGLAEFSNSGGAGFGGWGGYYIKGAYFRRDVSDADIAAYFDFWGI